MRLLSKISPIYKIASNHSKKMRSKGQQFSILKSASLIAVNSHFITESMFSNSISEVKSSEGFSIVDFKEEDVNEVKELLRAYYYHREPLSLMLHMSYEDHKEAIGDSIKKSIEDKVSTIARHRKSGLIVGCCLATIITRNQGSISDETFSNIHRCNVKTSSDAHLLDTLKMSVDLFKKYNVETILQLDHITVNPAYPRLGLAERLTRGNEMRGKNLGCQLVTVQATNVISQSLLRKHEYTEEFSIDYSDMTIDGKYVLDLSKNLNSTSAKLFSRHL